MDKILICTDLDRTLIPNGPEQESENARLHFSVLANRTEVVLAYVSGRDKRLVKEAIACYGLPIPDFVIGDVGTSIYRVGANQLWQRQIEWEDKIARDWHGKTYREVKQLLDDISSIHIQEDYKQNQFKLSYYVRLNQDKMSLTANISQKLSDAGLKARLVWSVDDIEEVGLLDILPLSASKLHAIEELMELLGFEIHNTVFCGDSGNDLEVLVSPIQAVLVGNSQLKVQQQASNQAKKNGNREQLYIARGNFRGMNGNFCAGMLEGIAHYFPATTQWMNLDTANGR